MSLLEPGTHARREASTRAFVRRLGCIGACVLALTLAATLLWRSPRPERPREEPVRFSIELPSGESLAGLDVSETRSSSRAFPIARATRFMFRLSAVNDARSSPRTVGYRPRGIRVTTPFSPCGRHRLGSTFGRSCRTARSSRSLPPVPMSIRCVPLPMAAGSLTPPTKMGVTRCTSGLTQDLADR